MMKQVMLFVSTTHQQDASEGFDLSKVLQPTLSVRESLRESRAQIIRKAEDLLPKYQHRLNKL